MKSIWELGMKDLVSASITKIEGSVTRTFAKIQQAENNLQKTLDDTSRQVERQSTAFAGLGTKVAAAFSLYAVASFGSQVYDTGTKLETLNNVINYTSGNAAEAAKNHAFLKQIVADYKLPLIETTDGFSQFNAALMGSALEGAPARDIFKGVSTAVTAMHLNGSQASQVFLALNQMVSKGTVSAQELKLQLGNALPGAFQLAAQSMGMTTAAFTKHMEQGDILANEFLPKFATALQEKYSGAIPAAIQSTVAKATELGNKWVETKDQFFIGMQPMINSLLDFANLIMPPVIAAVSTLFAWITAGIGWIQEHADGLQFLGTVVMGVVAAYGVMKGILWLNSLGFAGLTAAEAIQWGWMLLTTEGALAAAAAQWALNIALINNPIGWVITLIAALAGGVVYAWNKFEGFRAAIYGLWAAAKQVFSNIGDFFKRIFSPIFDAIAAIKEGRWADAAVATGKLVANLAFAPALAVEYAANGGFTKGVGDAYAGGAADGRASFARDQVAKDMEGKPVSSSNSILNNAASIFKTKPLAGPVKPAGAGDGSAGGGGGSGGSGSGSGIRNVTVTIGTLANITLHTTNLKESVETIRREVANALISSVSDYELAVAQ